MLETTTEPGVLPIGNDSGDVRVQAPVAAMSGEDSERRAHHSLSVEGPRHVAAGVRQSHQEIGSDEPAGRDTPHRIGHGEETVHLVELVQQADVDGRGLRRVGRSVASHGCRRGLL